MLAVVLPWHTGSSLVDSHRTWLRGPVGGQRTELVEVDRRIDTALVVPGSANAVLIHALPQEGETRDADEVRRVPFLHGRFALRLV
ncbi:MAG: hypothetical protein H6712_13305 [Myxococcales bacterium]|nr:hypothetical protein [Myxococcales bacterium]